MKATKDHISLETAKLLKDCGVHTVVKSKYVYWKDNTPDCEWVLSEGKYTPKTVEYKYILRAYTWQEILWEHAEKFFGKELITFGKYYLDQACLIHPVHLLRYLQERKYDEADEYFRKHCILITTSTNE